MVQGFNGLRHETIIRCHHEDHNVRDMRTTSAHPTEGGVARRVKESDMIVANRDTVSTDVLRDAASFPGRDTRLPNRIEQGRFPVIDMAHERDDRGAKLKFLRLLLFLFRSFGLFDDFLDLVDTFALFALLLQWIC